MTKRGLEEVNLMLSLHTYSTLNQNNFSVATIPVHQVSGKLYQFKIKRRNEEFFYCK